jgi:phosphoserine phosphatase
MAKRLPLVLMARAGLIDRQRFRDRWMVDFARFLRGFDREQLDQIGDWVVEHEFWPKRRDEVVTELRQRVAAGDRLLLASGTFEPVLAALARRLGAEGVGTPIEVREGRATGRVSGAVNTGAVKARRVAEALGGVVPAAAYGDTAADVPLLERTGEPVAVHPDAALARIARERGWRILSG